MGKIRELLQVAKNMGQEFIAITDHASTSALWMAQKLGKEIGIKVLLGSEFYYERENDNNNGHLIIIAKNDEGLKNIFKLQSHGYISNFYKKPRINWEILQQHKEGLVITSACMGSTFAQYLITGDITSAKSWAKKFQDVFGDDFYLEIQPNSIPEQLSVNQGTIRIAQQLGIKVVATNDVHYVLESDSFAHEVLLALQINKKMSDEKRWKFSTNDFWLKSEDEMINTFTGIPNDIIIEALNNTSLIANKCNAQLYKGKYLPKYYDVPDGETERSLLVKKVIDGAKKNKFNLNKSYMEEVQDEINVIDRNGYSGYFLIVQDYVNTARHKGIIVGDGRGSGAGSKVAYLTDISRIEPSKYNLLFERFMADGRSPDSIESTDVETYQIKFGERMTKRCAS